MRDNYRIEAKLTPEGGENGVTINCNYKPGDYKSCINCVKEIISKIDTVLDYNERASEMFDIELPTQFHIHIRLLSPKGVEIYSTSFRDDVIYYLDGILSNMNYVV